MKRKAKKKLPALDRMLEHHRSTCTYWVFSGDRHCSCGRDEAIAEVERLRAVEAKYLEMLEPVELPLFGRILQDA